MHTQNFFLVYTVKISCLNSSIVMRSVTKACAQRNMRKIGQQTETIKEREKERKEKSAFLFLEQALYLALDLSQIDWHLRRGKVTNRSNTAILAVRKTEIFDCNDVSYKTKCILVEETFRFSFCFPVSHVEMASGIIHVVLKKVAVIIRRTSKGEFCDLYNLCQRVRPAYKGNQA